MAKEMREILASLPHDSVVFSSWLESQGIDLDELYAYIKSGEIERISKGVYKLHGTTPALLAIISSYNTQLGKQCIVGAFSAFDLRGYSHYLSMEKPTAYLLTDKNDKLPNWLLKREWDMTIRYTSAPFIEKSLLGVEKITIHQRELLVSTPERAILECLNLPEAFTSLMDIYYMMENLTNLRPELVQSLLEICTSKKVKRLFLYMAEKANHAWLKHLKTDNLNLGKSRITITPNGKFINKYRIVISEELVNYRKP
ncbi:MAG: type IV toxin-antitoxin system AbiEi family antitoxin, partial [Bacteroidaceae bacterium]|nr:type IV toxin-antitoxin system AbiEi family antitoxin [Bacteroidaceae bacterium]